MTDGLLATVQFSEAYITPLPDKNETIAKEAQITQLTQYAETLEKRAKDVLKYQEYEIVREGQFKDKISHANSITRWCAILQAIVFIALGSWQIWSLRKYFIKRGIA